MSLHGLRADEVGGADEPEPELVVVAEVAAEDRRVLEVRIDQVDLVWNGPAVAPVTVVGWLMRIGDERDPVGGVEGRADAA